MGFPNKYAAPEECRDIKSRFFPQIIYCSEPRILRLAFRKEAPSKKEVWQASPNISIGSHRINPVRTHISVRPHRFPEPWIPIRKLSGGLFVSVTSSTRSVLDSWHEVLFLRRWTLSDTTPNSFSKSQDCVDFHNCISKRWDRGSLRSPQVSELEKTISPSPPIRALQILHKEASDYITFAISSTLSAQKIPLHLSASKSNLSNDAFLQLYYASISPPWSLHPLYFEGLD